MQKLKRFMEEGEQNVDGNAEAYGYFNIYMTEVSNGKMITINKAGIGTFGVNRDIG